MTTYKLNQNQTQRSSTLFSSNPVLRRMSKSRGQRRDGDDGQRRHRHPHQGHHLRHQGKLKRRDIPMLRRRIGIVFQDYQLLTDRNVFMNLYYVMKATGWKNESEIRKRIDEVLKVVSLEAKGYKMPFELSGGEQQRLVIARALLNRPRLLLADEPTGNLDPLTAEGIIRLFQEIARQGCAVVMSTHNTALIEEYPSRTILFSKVRLSLVWATSKQRCQTKTLNVITLRR